MMKKSLVLLALLSLYGTAYATGASDNCNGSGSCSGGGTTTNSPVGVGYGGNATGGTGFGVGIGGSSTATGGTGGVGIGGAGETLNLTPFQAHNLAHYLALSQVLKLATIA